MIPSSGGPPSTRDLLLLAARAGVLPGSPNSVDPFGMLRVLRVLAFPLPGPGNLGSHGSLGWRSPSLSFCHVALRGPGRVRDEGGGFGTGAAVLGSALRGPARDLHGGACPAPGERDTGWPGAGREWGARDSGSELHRPSPVCLLAPPPALSRKVPKRSPNVRKRNFLFPTLERAALRWLRGDLGTLLRRGRRPGVEKGGKDWEGGGENAEAPSSSFPLLDPAPLFQRAVFSSAPLFPAKLLLLKGPGFPSPPVRWAGGSRINPPPTRTFPPSPPPPPPGLHRLDFAPGRAGGWGWRWRGPRRPLPVCPVGIRPGAGTREGGKGAGRRCSNLFPSPGGGRGSGSYVRVCALTGPPTPPPCSAGGGGS